MSEAAAAPAAGFIGRALHGIAWQAGTTWVQLAVGVATLGLAAHYLSPADFGSVGTVTVLVGFAEVALLTPIGDALIQRATLEPGVAHGAFWLASLIAAVVVAALAAAAPWIAAGAGNPGLLALLPYGLAGLLLAPATLVATALLSRRLRFGELSRLTLAAQLVGTAAQMALLTGGAGARSLLLAALVSRVVGCGLLLRASGYRPGPLRCLAQARALGGFAGSTSMINLLGYAEGYAPQFITGWLLGPAALGYLQLSLSLLGFIRQGVLGPINRVTMTLVARLQQDRATLQPLLLTLYKAASLAGVPAFVGGILVMPDIAHLLGPRWIAVVLPSQLLLLAGLRLTTGMFNLPVLRGLGRNRPALTLLAAGLVLQVGFGLFGARFGVTGVAAAMVARTFATWPLGCWFIRQATGLSIAAQARAGGTAALGALAMAAVVLAVRLWPAASPLGNAALSVAVGCAAYAGVMAVLEPPLRVAAFGAARAGLRGDRGGVGRALRGALLASPAA